MNKVQKMFAYAKIYIQVEMLVCRRDMAMLTTPVASHPTKTLIHDLNFPTPVFALILDLINASKIGEDAIMRFAWHWRVHFLNLSNILHKKVQIPHND